MAGLFLWCWCRPHRLNTSRRLLELVHRVRHRRSNQIRLVSMDVRWVSSEQPVRSLLDCRCMWPDNTLNRIEDTDTSIVAFHKKDKNKQLAHGSSVNFLHQLLWNNARLSVSWVAKPLHFRVTKFGLEGGHTVCRDFSCSQKKPDRDRVHDQRPMFYDWEGRKSLG